MAMERWQVPTQRCYKSRLAPPSVTSSDRPPPNDFSAAEIPSIRAAGVDSQRFRRIMQKRFLSDLNNYDAWLKY